MPIIKKRIMHHNKQPIENFLRCIKNLGIRCVYFKPTSKDEANLFENNLTRSIHSFFNENDLALYLHIHSLMKDVKEKAYQLKKELEQYVEPSEIDVDGQTLENVKNFFDRVKKPLGKKPDGTDVNPIPEDEDMILLSRTVNMSQYRDKFILSNDRHFTEYSIEIDSEYGISVINEHRLLEYTQAIKLFYNSR
jgi:hypothetical protein